MKKEHVNMIMEEIMEDSKAFHDKYPLRFGQALSNTAFERFPTLMDKVPDGIDCYHSDTLIPIFLQWIEDQLLNL